MLTSIAISPNENPLQINLNLLPYSASERLSVDTKLRMLIEYLNNKYNDIKIKIVEDLFSLVGLEITFFCIEDAIEFKLRLDNKLDIL